MKPSIGTISCYPDLGECPLHLQQITKLCQQKQCRTQRYICSACETHKNHKTLSTQEYTLELAKKLAKNQPAQPERRKNLVQPFAELNMMVERFQVELEQTSKILRDINLRQCTVMENVLKLDEKQLYDYLCQIDLRKNGSAVEGLAWKMEQMMLGHPMAAKAYDKWVQEMIKRMNKFIINSQKIRDQALEISSFDFSSVLRQLQKQQPKPVSPPNPNPNPNPASQIRPISINLKQKDLISQQILSRISQHPYHLISSINMDTNSMNSQTLWELFDASHNFARLEELVMSNNYLDANCLEVLLNANIPNLKVLNIENNFIDQDQAFIEQLEKIKKKWPGINFVI